MASPQDFPSGLNLAGTVFANGPETLQLGGKVYLSGALPQWVDTINGNNANAGDKPELPVATLAQAVTNSATGGTIIVGAGSSEDLAASQAFAIQNLHIFGCGTGSSRPRYRCTGAVNMFNLSGQDAWLEGFYFPASTAAATSRVSVGSAGATVKNCYFEMGAADTNRSLAINESGAHIIGCSFVTVASRPAIGIQVVNAVQKVVVENCTFDGGSYGFSDYALKVTAAATDLTYRNLTFVNRANLGHTVTGTTFHIYGLDMGGTGNVLLTA